MIKQTKFIFILALCSTLIACSPESKDQQAASDSKETAAAKKKIEYKTIDWKDLIPAQPPTPTNLVGTDESGSPHIPISEMVVSGFDGQAIKMPGFIVPLEFKEEQVTTQFFLVPFFGACIHVPPPPPNQVVFVNYPKGLKLNALYDPHWISGIMKLKVTENDVATSAYTLEAHEYELYQR